LWNSTTPGVVYSNSILCGGVELLVIRRKKVELAPIYHWSIALAKSWQIVVIRTE